MQYKILSNSNSSTLVSMVNEFLNEGWSLQGGVSIAVIPGYHVTYAQAIIKGD
jgi:hypothetical protein